MTSSSAPIQADARRAARNVGALAITSLVSKGALFAWQIVLARWIGDGSYGVYGTVGSLGLITQIVISFSIGLIIIRDVARYPEQAGKYLSATLFIQTSLSIVAFILMNAAAWMIGYSETVRVFTALSAIGLLIDIYGNISSEQLLAQERIMITAIVEIVHIVLRIILVATALWLGYGLLGLYVMGWVVGIIRSLWLGVALNRTGVYPVFPLDRSILTQLLVDSLPLAAIALFTLIYRHADKLMSTRFLEVAYTGYLVAALLIVEGMIDLLNSTVLTAVYPMLSRYYEQGKKTLHIFIENLVFFTVLFTLPISLALSLFATSIVHFLYGETYLPAAQVLRILIWYGMVMMIVNVFVRGLMVQNRQHYLLAIRVIGLILNFTLNVIFLRLGTGIVGLAIASLITELFVLGFILLNFQRGSLYNLRRMWRAFILVIPVIMIMWGMGHIHFLLGMILGSGFYFLMLTFVGVLSESDWDLLYQFTQICPGGGIILHWWHRNVPNHPPFTQS